MRLISRACIVLAIVLIGSGSRPVTSAEPSVPAPAVNRDADQTRSQEADSGRTSAAELKRDLRADLEDGSLREFSLFQAALIAGGVDSLAEYQVRSAEFDVACRALRDRLRSVAGTRGRTDRILGWLHARMLTGDYRADCSAMIRTLERGDFNCLTATILFQELAAACGLEARAIMADSHVVSVVHGVQSLYVETTCPDWKSAPWSELPPRTRQVVERGLELTTEQLLGKVFYNQAVARLEVNDFAAAVELLHLARRLDDRDEAARQNLLAAYNNWALAESDRGAYRRAIDLVRQGQALDGVYEPLRLNDLHIHQKWIRALCDEGQFAAARELLEDAGRRGTDTRWFDRGREAVLEPGEMQRISRPMP